MKVFCKNCKHVRYAGDDFQGFYPVCSANYDVIDTPYQQYNQYKKCDDINRNNDCKDYEKKFKIRDLFKR